MMHIHQPVKEDSSHFFCHLTLEGESIHLVSLLSLKYKYSLYTSISQMVHYIIPIQTNNLGIIGFLVGKYKLFIDSHTTCYTEISSISEWLRDIGISFDSL